MVRSYPCAFRLFSFVALFFILRFSAAAQFAPNRYALILEDVPVTARSVEPGFALYQVNVIVPSGLSSGTQPVTVAIGDQTSKPLSLSVQ